MKAEELRELTTGELQERLDQLCKERFDYRMQKATGQLGQPHLAGMVRRDIARVKTLLAEKAVETETQAATQTATEQSA